MTNLTVDVAYALEQCKAVSALYAFADPEREPYRFAVALDPLSMQDVMAAHYAVLDATDHDVTGRILYFPAGSPPPLIDRRMQRVVVREGERFAARRRALDRARDPERRRRTEDDLGRMKDALARMYGRPIPRGPVAMSLGSWVLEVVPDPFPSPARPRRRVLIIDDGEDSEDVIAVDDVDVEHARDPWAAVERLGQEPFDLVVCAVALPGMSGRDLFRMAVAQRAELAKKFVFLASRGAVDATESARDSIHAVARPLDGDALRALLERGGR